MASSLPPPNPELVREIIKGGAQVLVILFCVFFLWVMLKAAEQDANIRHKELMARMEARELLMRTLIERCGPLNNQKSQIHKVPTVPITPTRGPLITNKGITERFGPFKEQLPP